MYVCCCHATRTATRGFSATWGARARHGLEVDLVLRAGGVPSGMAAGGRAVAVGGVLPLPTHRRGDHERRLLRQAGRDQKRRGQGHQERECSPHGTLAYSPLARGIRSASSRAPTRALADALWFVSALPLLSGRRRTGKLPGSGTRTSTPARRPRRSSRPSTRPTLCAAAVPEPRRRTPDAPLVAPRLTTAARWHACAGLVRQGPARAIRPVR